MRQFGGYVEMAPDNHGSLKIGEAWNFSFKYDFDRHAPANISWGPMGSYMKLNDGQTVDVISEPIKFPDSHVINKIKKYAPETEGYSFFNQEEPVKTDDMDSSQHILAQTPIKTD